MQSSKRQKTSGSCTEAEKKQILFVRALKFIENDNSEGLRNLLLSNKIFDINILNLKGLTLLMKSAEAGHLKCVQTLLKLNANVNRVYDEDSGQSYGNSTALYLASKEGHYEIVKTLLQYHADPNDLDYRALYAACAKGNSALAELLIEHGAELTDDQDEFGTNAFKKAVYSGNIKLIEYLIKHGADIHDYNKYSQHALIQACKRDNIGVMEVLLKHGADINVTEYGADTDFDSCIHIACKKNNINMIRFLLQHNADVNVYNMTGETPFSIAYRKNNRLVIDLLLQHGLDLNCEDNNDYNNFTPLMHACFRGDVEMVELLIKHGADVNIIRQDCLLTGTAVLYKVYSAIIVACARGYVEVLKVLLGHNVDVNRVDKRGYTPLMYLLSPPCGDWSGWLGQSVAEVELVDVASTGGGDVSGSADEVRQGDAAVEGDDEAKGEEREYEAVEDGGGGEFVVLQEQLEANQGATGKGTTSAATDNNDDDDDEEEEEEDYDITLNAEDIKKYKHNSIQCAQLLLSHGTDLSIKNSEGKTVYDYIKEDSIMMRLIKESSLVKPTLK